MTNIYKAIVKHMDAPIYKNNGKGKLIPHPRHYWGIIAHEELYFSGTFAECWSKLVADFGDKTLATLTDSGISIKRIK